MLHHWRWNRAASDALKHDLSGARPDAERPYFRDHPTWLTVALPLVAFAAIVCLRMPQIIISGRFWAEEGREFFHNAWIMPPTQALFTAYAGYLNLLASASALIACWTLPLPYAPYLTILIALLVQLCPPLLLLNARDRWLQPRHIRLAALLLVLLVPASEEIWLNTLCCQFELTLCCAIILALDVTFGRMAWVALAILALAPLCGPTAIVLIPLFVLRTILDRSRIRAIQTATLTATAAIQLLLFFHAVPGRAYSLDPFVLLCVLSVRHIELPFLGVSHADIVATLIRARLTAGYIPKWATLLPIILFGSLAAATLWHRCARSARWLLGAAAMIAAISYCGALGGAATLIDARTGARYSFVPQALLALALLAVAATSHRWTARASGFAVVWLLAVGAWEFVHPWPLISKGPAWRKEVALWQADPSHALEIWPSGWSVMLDPKRQ